MGDDSASRGSMTRPRHIFVSGADAGLLNRWMIGRRTNTTAANAKRLASSWELPATRNAKSAASSPIRIGASSTRVRHWAVVSESEDAVVSTGGRAGGRLRRDSRGGNGSTLSLRARISSISRSTRDLLDEAESSGVCLELESFTVSSWDRSSCRCAIRIWYSTPPARLKDGASRPS